MKRQFIIYGLLLIAGIFLGWLLFHPSTNIIEEHNHSTEEKQPEIWTCAMHPQIRMEKPGKCPICAMDLIPVGQSGTSNMDPSAIHLSREAMQLANVETSIVTSGKPVREIRLYGKVQADERLIQSQVAFVPGRIEKLLVNFTGETVRRGQTLAVIYSPELVTAQQELLEADKSRQSQPEIYEAAKEKLRQWKLTPLQIEAIETSGKIKSNLDITSTSNGIVTARRVNNGDYVNQGTVLFEVSDLSKVWVQFDGYESDLQFLKKGSKVEFTLQAMPGESFTGSVAFIDPSIDPVTRIARVRVELNNPQGKFKPEMFATGIVKTNPEEFKGKLIIPRSAILWTGKRSLVYVKLPGKEPLFKIREVGLGPVLGENYLITDGLQEGEEIVTQGTFSVDAASQLQGKSTMMNQPMNQESKTIMVAGNCDMCKERIEKVAKLVAGVSSAEWNATDKLLRITFDKDLTSLEKIEKAVAESGHDTELFRAKDEVYNSLPGCCKYERTK